MGKWNLSYLLELLPPNIYWRYAKDRIFKHGIFETIYEGNKKKYTIYSKFTTTSDDTSFLNTNVDVPTIALSCCTDASDDNRIIILGRAD